MAVFFAWEKLRVLYNLVLFAVVICNFNPFDSLILAVRFLELTVAANLCFCVGPVLENYFCWFAYPHKPRSPLRWCMFVIGLVFSIPVSIVVCEQIAVHPEGRWQLGL